MRLICKAQNCLYLFCGVVTLFKEKGLDSPLDL